MTASEFIRQKVPVPSAMLTRDWDRVQAAVRERSFFMASVVEAEILEAFREGAVAMADGTVNEARASEMVREKLKALGYAPAKGTEGSIKDLSSWRRLAVTLSTNRALAQGYAGHARALKAAAVYPAKRMIRQTVRKEPRDWPRRFAQAAAMGPAAGVNGAEMAAHVRHPVWRRVSRFGLPYPIYDFGSGMGDKVLRMAEAKALGVDMAPPRGPTEAEDPSLNEDLEATPAVQSPEVREALAARMKGTARWEGDRLVYLDPNGTRELSAEEAGRVIRTAPVAGEPRYQAAAVDRYLEKGDKAFAPGSDALYDMGRLVQRTVPMAQAPAVLWWSRAFRTDADREMFLEALAAGEPVLTDAGWPWVATSTDAGTAMNALTTDGPAVTVAIRGAQGARDIRPAMGGAEGRPGIFLGGGFRVKIVKTDRSEKMTTVTAEWIGGGE